MSQDLAPETRAGYLHNLAQQIQTIDLKSLTRNRFGWPDFTANKPKLPAVQALHQIYDDLSESEINDFLGLVFPEEKAGQAMLCSQPQDLVERLDRGLIIAPDTDGHLQLPPEWNQAGHTGELTVTISQDEEEVTFEGALLGQESIRLTLELSKSGGLREAMLGGHETFWQFMKDTFPQWHWPVGQPPRPPALSP